LTIPLYVYLFGLDDVRWDYFIRAGTNLCALRTGYTRSLRFIRSHPDLSALIKKYARSYPVMRGETDICDMRAQVNIICISSTRL